MECTRLAPSPTGALHLGNARTFLANWLLARQRGWRVLLRIEDLDGPRVKPEAARELIEDLHWLGLDWDEGPFLQSVRALRYARALEQLLVAGDAYPCTCTRREVELSASAPHAEDGAAVYPGTCRDRFATIEEAREMTGRLPAIRFRVPVGAVGFTDQFRGVQVFDPAAQLGDFVIAKSDGTPAYQLAVVVDDAEMGVTQVVRGDDLLDSTPRQLLLYHALHLREKVPKYWHLPLVAGPDGRRLAKRHGDTRLSRYREAGVPATGVLRYLAESLMMGCDAPPAGAADLVKRFQIEKIPKTPVTFTADDDAKLLSLVPRGDLP